MRPVAAPFAAVVALLVARRTLVLPSSIALAKAVALAPVALAPVSARLLPLGARVATRSLLSGHGLRLGLRRGTPEPTEESTEESLLRGGRRSRRGANRLR